MAKTKFESVNAESVKDLLQLMTAYQRSNVLFTFVELEIAETLNDKSLSSAAIAEIKKIDKLAMERFLNAAVIIGLLKRKNKLFSNTAMTENFLIGEKEFYLGGQINRHRKRSSKVWAKLTKNLKDWQYGGDGKTNPDKSDQGAKAMAEQHNLALLHGFALAEAFDFSEYKKILDLGGGTGASSIALCQSFPNLQSIIFELPENVEIAEKFIADNNLTDRVQTVSGDFKRDALPKDFDAVLLANFMSVAAAADNIKLLKKIYKQLPESGVCILSGWIIDDSHLAPQISVLFCLEDICWNAPDVERDEKIYTEWLKETGFTKIKCETYLEPTKMLYGFKE
ncbi:MAG: acetylserotonin O-methyltransferase [Pyrinomonadaceae bacterium]|nr:acetylserotonin O-methyltransferase [Pyrinomonadaceae bacterium]